MGDLQQVLIWPLIHDLPMPSRTSMSLSSCKTGNALHQTPGLCVSLVTCSGYLPVLVGQSCVPAHQALLLGHTSPAERTAGKSRGQGSIQRQGQALPLRSDTLLFFLTECPDSSSPRSPCLTRPHPEVRNSGPGYSSAVECLPSIHEALSLTPSTT